MDKTETKVLKTITENFTKSLINNFKSGGDLEDWYKFANDMKNTINNNNALLLALIEEEKNSK